MRRKQDQGPMMISLATRKHIRVLAAALLVFVVIVSFSDALFGVAPGALVPDGIMPSLSDGSLDSTKLDENGKPIHKEPPKYKSHEHKAEVMLDTVTRKPKPEHQDLDNFDFDRPVDVEPPPTLTWLQRQHFIDVAVENPLTGHLNMTALTQLCNQTKWDTSILLQSHAIRGGIGNVRNELLYFLRYAIAAGTSIILPQFLGRSEEDPKVLAGQMKSLGYLFDSWEFARILATACPQMPVYMDLDHAKRELEPQGEMIMTPLVSPHYLPFYVPGETEANLELFRQYTYTMKTPKENDPPRRGNPTWHAPFDAALGRFSVCHDPYPLASTFSRLLPTSKDIQRLAAGAMDVLRTYVPKPLSPEGITPGAYLGAHLRSDPDTENMNWTTYDRQQSYYIEAAQKGGYQVIYLASGTASSTANFTDAANAVGIKVVTKRDMFVGFGAELFADRVQFAGLTWDQQALIDYFILERASKFVGIAESSFSWNVALSRRVLSKQVPLCNGNVTGEGTGEYALEEGVVFRDELSEVIGKEKADFGDGLWP